MIEIKGLTKVFKLNKKQMAELKTKNPLKTAVDDVSFTARPGEIYGLLWGLTEPGRRPRSGVFPRC